MKIKVNYIDSTETPNVSFAKKYGGYTRAMIEAKNKYAEKYEKQ